MEEVEPEFKDFVEKATAGILHEFENDSKRQKARMNEFLSKQTQLLNTVHSELIKFGAIDSLQLEDMFYLLKSCQARLLIIKDRMRKASTKIAKLKARSLKIQQTKQKEALERELRREAQLTLEQEMVKTPHSPNRGFESSQKSVFDSSS
uniref:Biogenesis of lysosome-related organelles complex 1 subunit 6 n=1 Tax=Graphocephala atropunctata TaxID=36148 RepID=A0A1B6KNV7_9HEMI